MILSIIAAIGKNNELGKDNALLWNLPADMKHFRETTTGHPMIMGRKTFESIGRPLPNRENIVITSDTTYTREGIIVVHSLEDAIERYKRSDQEVFVIGGGRVYEDALHYADKLYMTHVDAALPADTFFPDIQKNMWKEISREAHTPDEKNPFPYAFVTYEKMPVK